MTTKHHLTVGKIGGHVTVANTDHDLEELVALVVVGRITSHTHKNDKGVLVRTEKVDVESSHLLPRVSLDAVCDWLEQAEASREERRRAAAGEDPLPGTSTKPKPMKLTLDFGPDEPTVDPASGEVRGDVEAHERVKGLFDQPEDEDDPAGAEAPAEDRLAVPGVPGAVWPDQPRRVFWLRSSIDQVIAPVWATQLEAFSLVATEGAEIILGGIVRTVMGSSTIHDGKATSSSLSAGTVDDLLAGLEWAVELTTKANVHLTDPAAAIRGTLTQAKRLDDATLENLGVAVALLEGLRPKPRKGIYEAAAGFDSEWQRRHAPKAQAEGEAS